MRKYRVAYRVNNVRGELEIWASTQTNAKTLIQLMYNETVRFVSVTDIT